MVQAFFNEWNIQVGAVVDRGITGTVFRQQFGRNHLLPHIGRVADRMGEAGAEFSEEEISLY